MVKVNLDELITVGVMGTNSLLGSYQKWRMGESNPNPYREKVVFLVERVMTDIDIVEELNTLKTQYPKLIVELYIKDNH